MFTFNPRRTFLILPAWCWAAVCLMFVVIAWSLGPALAVDEPLFVSEAFGPTIYITRDGDGFKVVPTTEVASTVPVWAIGRNKSVQTFVSFTRVLPVVPDLYYQDSHFRYGLFASAHGSHWEPGKGNPKYLSRRDSGKLQPILVNELNARYKDQKRGDQLNELLQNGVKQQSWLSRQNWLTGFALFSMAITVAATISMFVPVRKPQESPEPVEAPEIAVVA